MHISNIAIRDHEIAKEKYSDRTVKIFCNNRMAWISSDSYVIDKFYAKIFLLKDAIDRFYSNEHIDYHFLDPIGDDEFKKR